MANIKLEHIDNLRRGKKSGAKIGSRGVPHHLYEYEQKKYELALKNKYLQINTKDRVNLRNLWHKVCLAKGWKYLILLKDFEQETARILLDDAVLCSGNVKILKHQIQDYV